MTFPIHALLQDAWQAAQASHAQSEEKYTPKLLGGLALLCESEVTMVADALAAMGFRDAKKIAYGSEALILEVGEGQVLRYIAPHPDHVQRMRAVEPMVFQPVLPHTELPAGFVEVFYKKEFHTIDAYHTPPDDPAWEPMKKTRAALAKDGYIIFDLTSGNFLTIETKDGERMLVGDPGNDVYTEETDAAFFALMQPALLEDFDPAYGFADRDGIWHQKKTFPNIVTGEPFDAAYPGTGKIAGVLSDKELEEIRRGGEIAVWRADGTRYSPPLPHDRQEAKQFKETFCDRVEAGEYPLPVLSRLLEGRGDSLPQLNAAPFDPRGPDFRSRIMRQAREPFTLS